MNSNLLISAAVILMGVVGGSVIGCTQAATEVEKEAETTQRSLKELELLNKMALLCDNNGGIKLFDMHPDCGRYCSYIRVVCNNGMSLRINR